MARRTGTIGADVLFGTLEADWMSGGDGADLLVGDLGDDTLEGEAGNDVLAGGDGLDLLLAGDGNDLVFGEAGNDTLAGGLGSDILNAGEGDDVAMGDDGDDVLVGGGGGDALSGGDGNDALAGEIGDDTLDGGLGDDILSGEIGNDTLLGGAGADLLIAGDGQDALGGGDGVDTLSGGEGADSLDGGEGSDILVGGADGDFLDGGTGDDVLAGDDGDDLVLGAGGNDVIFAGAGNDELDGGSGVDVLNAGAGNDTIHAGDGGDVLVGGDGDDIFTFDRAGDATGSIVLGESGFDVLRLNLSSEQLHDTSVLQALNSLAAQAADPNHENLVQVYEPLGLVVGSIEQLEVNGSIWSTIAAPVGNTIYVDPGAAAGGNGSAANPFNDWGQVQWQAGWSYLQKAGTIYEGTVLVTGDGTAAAPIAIGSYGDGAPPQVLGAVTFYGAAHVELQGFEISGSNYAGILVSNGSHDINVHGNSVHDSLIGVVIATDAGGGNRVAENDIHGNDYFGVAVHAVVASGAENTIAANQVHDNGSHGMELAGAGGIINGNLVENNGISVGGASGIHVIAGAQAGSGSRFAIEDNVVVGTRDVVLADGNGIQLDVGAHANLVQGNFAHGNDGAGILLYGAHDNAVRDNVLLGNVRDEGGTHWLDAEMAITAEPGANPESVAGNVLAGNQVFAQSQDVAAILIDGTSAGAPQAIGNNYFESVDHVYSWAGTQGGQVTAWNTLAAGNGDDAFAGAPLAGADQAGNLAYSFGTTGQAAIVDGTVVDVLGWSVTSGLVVDFG